MKYVKKFKELTLQDISLVGGKNASLGQMIRDLSHLQVEVPDGFALTVDAYWATIDTNGLRKILSDLLAPLTVTSPLDRIQKSGKTLRALFEDAVFSDDVQKEIVGAYQQLCKTAGVADCSVAVRSSATAEDLPDASFAGQQETYLNVKGTKALLQACKDSMGSLFTDRAIMYRLEKGYDHMAVGLSVGVQYMVRSDKACSGVLFTLDTETGFKESVVITSSYGLGESVVKGEVVPDEFHVFKPTLEKGFKPIIKKRCGSKTIKKVFKARGSGIVTKPVLKKEQLHFSLTDAEILELARCGMVIEKHYSDLKKAWCPLDIEWAKDGITGKLYIVQARPETIHALQIGADQSMITYHLEKQTKLQVLVAGQSIGQKIVSGRARVVASTKQMQAVEEGDIIVTRMTDPDWVPVMKKAAGIITENGGRTCHAAIVSRELGIPAIVGAAGAMKKIKNGQHITMDCSKSLEGLVYAGVVPFKVEKTALKNLPKAPVPLYVNSADPDQAYAVSQLPVDGVGLARVEFIIANTIKLHPMACVEPEKVTSKRIQKEIKAITAAYKDTIEFFIETLAQGIGSIAAAFYPRFVLVRFSDFKSNEYRGLLAGSYFEPQEENPMIGLRGASRYYSPLYEPAFELECKAIRYAREHMGLTNIHVMIPFVRTVDELKKVVAILKKQGLVSGKDGLKIFMMCELPSNVILLESFAQHCDGFSIGSNDLTQTTLSVDRDSGLLAPLFDEHDPAVLWMFDEALRKAKKVQKPMGICGQAPSDHPDIAAFLLERGISSLSLNPDSVIPFLLRMQKGKKHES